MSYNRGPSPPTRRSDPRFADAVADAYQSHRHNSSVLPRSSNDRVIPLSTQTFVTSGGISSTSGLSRSSASGFDPYGGRSGRYSPVESSRTSTSTNNARTRTTVLQGNAARTISPARDDRGYYVTTVGSKSDRDSRGAQKIYSTSSGGARLISETDIGPESSRPERHRSHRHRRTESGDVTAQEGGRYLASQAGSRRGGTIDDADSYSYTDPASMYRDTDPIWRQRGDSARRDSFVRGGDEAHRPRRGSLDRSEGETNRVRRSSLDRGDGDTRVDYGMDLHGRARRSREYGPPVSSRGWDKITDGIGRTKSLREGPRGVDKSPHRGRDDERYADSRDPYYIAPRRGSLSRTQNAPTERYVDKYATDRLDDRYEPQHRDTRSDLPKAKDRSVSRRGFGIRSDSQARDALHHSDESLDSLYDRDGHGAAHRDIASDTERTSKRRSKHRDPHTRRDRDREYSPLDSDREFRRNGKDDHDHRRRDDSRDDKRGAGPGAAVAAGGLAAGAAALYGISNRRAGDDEPERKRTSEDPRARLSDTAERDAGQRKGINGSVPYPDAADRDADHGLGFAFERPADLPTRTRDSGRTDASREASQDNRRVLERSHEDTPPALSENAPLDPDEEYRQRILQAQRELGHSSSHSVDDPDRERRRRERETRLQQRREHLSSADAVSGASPGDRSSVQSSSDSGRPTSSTGERPVVTGRPELQRRASIVDEAMPPDMGAIILDNSQSEQRETRVRIVDPPTEEEEKKPRGILKRPTQKFPEEPIAMREGVAPLKDSTKKGIPPGARWTKIDRRLVNPQALEDAKERYEERVDCVIVLRVLTKEEIQKLADRTKAIREKRFDAEDRAEKRNSHRDDRKRDRRERDEYSDDSGDEWDQDKRPVRMLDAVPAVSEHSDRRSER